MKQLTENEILWANFVKALRSNIRLKHSLAADRELNERLPKFEKDFNTAFKAGKAKEFAISATTEVADEVV